MNFKQKVVVIIFILILFSSCVERIEAPKNSKISGKHIVFDSDITLTITDTTDSKKYNKSRLIQHNFKLDGKIYKPEYSYKLYADGTLHQRTIYCADEPEVYLKTKLDTIDIDGAKVSIKFSPLRNQIIDITDTLDIEKIYEKEKLILVKQKSYKGRIVFYTYN